METYRLFINGQFEASQSTDTVDVMDPSSMQRLAVVPDAGEADVDRAVGAARRRSKVARCARTERGRILMRLAETLRGRAEELAILETRNTGKPLVEAESDIEDAATCFDATAASHQRCAAT
jgi:betaine-aldehyde dehydrogenase